MNRFTLACKMFFKILRGDDCAAQAQRLLSGELQAELAAARQAATKAAVAAPKAAPEPAKPMAPVRSEALTLLAVLQQDARLVDFLMEPIQGYEDAQIGAAVRDIHRDCGAVLMRLFELKPLQAAAEGSALEVPAGFDSAAWKLTGKVSGRAPYRGTLRHPGWVAGKCDVPVWSGRAESARVVAPAEVEVS